MKQPSSPIRHREGTAVRIIDADPHSFRTTKGLTVD